ncbi:MAG: hypothetical protein JNL34_05810 [Anaerolineae bacterium]|nr:hypothetical protein [Anaerolineae bacterium]
MLSRLFLTGSLLFWLVPAGLLAAQEPASDLQAESVEVIAGVSDFGQPVVNAVGALANTGTSGLANVFVTARAYDTAGDQIAEGYGVLVNACGAGLLPDYVIAPGHSQPFSAPLEFFADYDDPIAEVDRIEIESQAGTSPAFDFAALADGITQVSDQEAVAAQWLEDGTLRYAIGCAGSLFTEWDWRELDADGRDAAVEYPVAALVTDALRERLQLTDPALFANSRLSFAPAGGRLVYQDGVNRFYTAADDGTLQRRLYTGLHNRVLQTIDWLGGSRFLASYFGAFGEPVIWFTADAEGRAISPAPSLNRPSVIVPGATADGRRVVIGGTFDTEAGAGVTGYYLNVVTNGFFELLFEASLPGNNFPPPVPVVDPVEDVVARVYVVRPVDEQVMLQCFNRGEGVLHDLAALPGGLLTSDRSGLWLSPDESELALTANGPAGGLWLIDLNALPACGDG